VHGCRGGGDQDCRWRLRLLRSRTGRLHDFCISESHPKLRISRETMLDSRSWMGASKRQLATPNSTSWVMGSLQLLLTHVLFLLQTPVHHTIGKKDEISGERKSPSAGDCCDGAR